MKKLVTPNEQRPGHPELYEKTKVMDSIYKKKMALGVIKMT
jgi:hypothetical protein